MEYKEYAQTTTRGDNAVCAAAGDSGAGTPILKRVFLYGSGSRPQLPSREPQMMDEGQ